MTRFKREQGSCSFKCGDEEEGSYIQKTPAESPFSIQQLKLQVPCPPFQMVSLTHTYSCQVDWVLYHTLTLVMEQHLPAHLRAAV